MNRIAPLALLALAGCTMGADTRQAPAALAEGACIDTSRVVSRRGIGENRLDFELTGGRRYTTTLPGPCPHLSEIDRTYTLVYESFTGGRRVCAGDRFRVVDLRAGGPGAASSFTLCRFGPLVEQPAAR